MGSSKYISYYYQIMDLSKEELKRELAKWSRQDLIDWLKWNDPNGIYRDEESMDELGNIMSYEEGVEIMIRQIIQE
jgi:hypothetical protein